MPTADILEHIPACNALIEAALARNDGVLVHCQAGMSQLNSQPVRFPCSNNLDRSERCNRYCILDVFPETR